MTHSTNYLEHTVWQQTSYFTYDTLPETVYDIWLCKDTVISLEFQLVTVNELDISLSWSVLTFIVWPLNLDVHADDRSYFHLAHPCSWVGDRFSFPPQSIISNVSRATFLGNGD